MKAESAVLVSRQAGMWALWVKPLHQPVYEVALVEIAPKKSDRRQPTQRFTGRWCNPSRNLIQKSFEKWTELAVCSRPIASRVGVDRLLELALRHVEAMFFEQSINFALYRR